MSAYAEFKAWSRRAMEAEYKLLTEKDPQRKADLQTKLRKYHEWAEEAWNDCRDFDDVPEESDAPND